MDFSTDNDTLELKSSSKLRSHNSFEKWTKTNLLKVFAKFAWSQFLQERKKIKLILFPPKWTSFKIFYFFLKTGQGVVHFDNIVFFRKPKICWSPTFSVKSVLPIKTNESSKRLMKFNQVKCSYKNAKNSAATSKL